LAGSYCPSGGGSADVARKFYFLINRYGHIITQSNILLRNILLLYTHGTSFLQGILEPGVLSITLNTIPEAFCPAEWYFIEKELWKFKRFPCTLINMGSQIFLGKEKLLMGALKASFNAP